MLSKQLAWTTNTSLAWTTNTSLAWTTNTSLTWTTNTSLTWTTNTSLTWITNTSLTWTTNTSLTWTTNTSLTWTTNTSLTWITNTSLTWTTNTSLTWTTNTSLTWTTNTSLTWTTNTSMLVNKAQQRLFFLRKLKQAKLPQKLLLNFYRSTTEIILTNSATVWCASCTAAERQDLHRVVKAAQRIVRMELPGLDTIYSSRLRRKAIGITRDTTHPGHSLFDSLPSSKRFRTLKARTNRLRNSFYPRAVASITHSLRTETETVSTHKDSNTCTNGTLCITVTFGAAATYFLLLIYLILIFYYCLIFIDCFI
ncbi:uncharacterized protein LOC132403735 [Hypanus sabinus]|uniref:uncharacterized protein LOC132403735 n=1 Tax=Hypanus sabinus TaxID=79690 RepID=UPI0028C50D32|nr:uncharacterized protein LOC132403735 [Hypanus sabinus]XP_059843357.1 uncharacterized protein LOC132403735 [Hypanus sabinus]